MTEKEKYATLLAEIGALLEDKNTEILFLKYQVEDLKGKLAQAEEAAACRKTAETAKGAIEKIANSLHRPHEDIVIETR